MGDIKACTKMTAAIFGPKVAVYFRWTGVPAGSANTPNPACPTSGGTCQALASSFTTQSPNPYTDIPSNTISGSAVPIPASLGFMGDTSGDARIAAAKFAALESLQNALIAALPASALPITI